MIPEHTRTEVIARLRAAEVEHDVRILLAIESGSRAWGFASPNSDFDVRFVYANRPEWYLSVGLEEKRDVIEYPIVDDIDISGWDVRKALRLFRRSNPSLTEWLQSPLIYLEHGSFAERVRGLTPSVYSRVKGIHHYRSMARRNYRGHLQGDRVRLKKYFYVLRPLLAVRWLERYGTPAPMEFESLLHLLDGSAVVEDILTLLARKRASPELGLASPVPSINAFIEAEMARLDDVHPAVQERDEQQPSLDDVFRESLRDAWSV